MTYLKGLSFRTNLGNSDVFEVPPLETEQFRAGYLVLLEGVAVHGEADGLQPLRHLVRTPLYDDLKQATSISKCSLTGKWQLQNQMIGPLKKIRA